MILVVSDRGLANFKFNDKIPVIQEKNYNHHKLLTILILP